MTLNKFCSSILIFCFLSLSCFSHNDVECICDVIFVYGQSVALHSIYLILCCSSVLVCLLFVDRLGLLLTCDVAVYSSYHWTTE